ncbi:hypothetical protein MVES1_001584 [Malassezia vespertilionis]|uniref:uncharacterized protein n=1 Tax=Malassezia vespertilionis TaxID=2020962 RepID=UPI0024B0871D|nr:uncharacterized protein MVES1_001584 [Malassezia vespertilionis]WFD06240.1 hypothetical protein MVES1_001584 [Malassezia vespertilionis]
MATLNVRDALSYLDQVKVQFTDHPDVYNRFLDIMKDFKSQTIDTPGVIERVSTLFRGQPSLIQGFNTFLPPGYRIECSVDQNDGNMITVTTPAGTTTQTLGGVGIAGAINRMNGKGSNMAQSPPHGMQLGPVDRVGSPQRHAPPSQPAYSPQEFPENRAPGLSMNGRPLSPSGPPKQRPVAYGMPPGSYEPAPPEGVRPPVEFNHAINYVNKIKQRFSGDPDTYKQFLEILQTYQKEQRPIHEVYAQVTVLFDHAKDLLDEFKQFLPDTGAPGGGTGGGLFGMLGHVTNGMGPPDAQPINYERLPPNVPQPAPIPPPGRKKRSVGGVEDTPYAADVPMHLKNGARSKRTKHAKVDGLSPPAPYMQSVPHGEAPEMYAPMPGIAPGYEPMPPGAPGYMQPPMYDMQSYPPMRVMGGNVMQMPHMASLNEVAFFDRVKKHMDDRATYLDFLKLLNLYTQDVIDVNTLVDRAALFLGGQPELLAAFKSLVGYDMSKHGWTETEDVVLENVPALERDRVDLHDQRSYGPSYRRLPESEVNLACSGRDPLCWEVLNDKWISHPTWVSEGESFNPHKKNVYEDALYRSEEERHEYDYHIEANLRTIALLEPIAARIAVMDAEERASFRLKPGLGGQSKSIYQRIIKKVYGREHGLEVIAALHDNPAVAVPVVLARLKQKDEEWKRAQREWNKVWREVDARNFYEALDHQGVNFKSMDKKAITTKSFVHEIETLRAAQQQTRLELDRGLPAIVPRFQLEYLMADGHILADVLRLSMHFMDRAASGFSAHDRERIESTFQALLPKLFGISQEAFATLLVRKRDEEEEASVEEEEESEFESQRDLELRRARKGGDLRKHALRNNAESHAGQGTAPASTWHVNTEPEALSAASNAKHSEAAPANIFVNTMLYVFVRLLQLLYARLHKLRTVAQEMVQAKSDTWTKVNPLAAELGMIDTASGPAGMVCAIAAAMQARNGQAPHSRLSKEAPAHAQMPPSDRAVLQLDPAYYYAILLELITRLLDGEIDQSSYEECVRFMYGTHGYIAVTFDKVIHALVKGALTISADTKSQELLHIFDATEHALAAIRTEDGEASEARDVRLYRRLIGARMDAENVVGRDEHLFRIEVAPAQGTQEEMRATVPPHKLHIQLLSHDDLTLEDPKDREQRWLQYMASYCLWAPTEGLAAETLAPLLKRNLPASPETADAQGTRYVIRNGLDIRVCMHTYRLFFVQGSEDVFARMRSAEDKEALARNAAARSRRWNAWLDARRAALDAPAEEQVTEEPDANESLPTHTAPDAVPDARAMEQEAQRPPSSDAQSPPPMSAAGVSNAERAERVDNALGTQAHTEPHQT